LPPALPYIFPILGVFGEFPREKALLAVRLEAVLFSLVRRTIDELHVQRQFTTSGAGASSHGACLAAGFDDSVLSLGSREEASVHMVCVYPQFVAVAKPVVRTVLRALFEAMYCLHAPWVARTSGTGSGGLDTATGGVQLLFATPPQQQPAEQPMGYLSIIISFY
jgi:hypothetical protein